MKLLYNILIIIGLLSCATKREVKNSEEPVKFEYTNEIDTSKIPLIGDRLIMTPVDIQNNSGEDCTVVVENIVLANGEIYSTKVLQNHPRTTTKNPLAFEDAIHISKQIKYSADPNAKEYEKDIKFIRFELK